MSKDATKPEPRIPTLLTADDLARVLQLSARSVRRLIDEGRCPQPVRISRRSPRWEPKAVEEWIAKGCPRCRRKQSK